MGNTTRCARCNKGITNSEKAVFIDDLLYHVKCAERLSKGKK